MITADKYLSTTDSGGTWQNAPQWVTTAGTRQQVVDMAARNEWVELASATPATYREWKETGTSWMGYEKAVVQANPEPSDDDPVAAVYLSGTVVERAAAQRESIRSEITLNREVADVINIDLRADPGRQVLMDEANDRSEAKLNQLVATDDADLDTFDTTLDPTQVRSVATAASLYEQTAQVLVTDPTLDAQQTADLQALQASYAQVVIDGDDSAAVPVPTDNVRLKLGVAAEGFGTIQAKRAYDGVVWWNLEFELRVNRELSVDDYWIAVYDGGGTYLTTPFLTEVSDGVYRANAGAVNLPRPDQPEFQYTLCHQHISNEMFDRLVLPEDVNESFDPIRWGGNAS